MSLSMQNPIIAGFDVDEADECVRLGRLLKGRIGAIKLGPRLVVRYGQNLIQEMATYAPVFVDNKYLDIPTVMEAAVRTTFHAGATIATVHAWSGSEALRLLSGVANELSQIRPFQLLAVTVLTSFNTQTMPPPLQQQSIAKQVDELADLALDCGITGLVCSPQEVASLRAKSAKAFLVTPGIRMPGDDTGDQKRIESPAATLLSGSSALVIGRPICMAADPVQAVESILESLRQHDGLASLMQNLRLQQ